MNLDVEKVRNNFPVLSNSIYMNTGGTGPISKNIAEEIQTIYEYARDYGPDTPNIKSDLENRMEDARVLSASFLNVPVSSIAFIRAISEGMNIVAHGMNWHQGDEIILSSEEHPSGVIPWLNLRDKFGVKVTKVKITDDKNRFLSNLESLINDNTKLISLSHVTTDTGHKLPAKEICSLAHEYGIPVIFDGAQSVGQFSIDLNEIDCEIQIPFIPNASLKDWRDFLISHIEVGFNWQRITFMANRIAGGNKTHRALNYADNFVRNLPKSINEIYKYVPEYRMRYFLHHGRQTVVKALNQYLK